LKLTVQSQIILTGAIGAGKSTYVRKLIHQANLAVAGFVTEKIFEDSVIVGFTLREIDGESRIIAHRDFIDKPQFAGFGVDPSIFDTFGCAVIARAIQSGRLVLIDELGVMEQGAENFCAAARAIISGDAPYLIVIQQRALDFWLSGIRHGGVTEINNLKDY